MRLLHWTENGFALEDVADPSDYRYAILSHRWHDDGEILYADILAYPNGPVAGWTVSHGDFHAAPIVPKARAWQKLRYAMQQTRKDGLEYLWVDTCCIDKTSSAELSESINSMYTWYQLAVGCYAYLSDVPGDCPLLSDASDSHWKHAFANSIWFGRGWTLQELIAPRIVHFFGADWNYLGVMTGLVQTIAECTAIHSKLLSGEYALEVFNMAQRISWMAGRATTRVEDEAYCLLGLLGVNMPLLYGEGRIAFQRLQEEVIRSNDDLSVFAWNAPGAEAIDDSRFSLLAPSPASFTGCEGMWRTRGYHGACTFQLNNVSLQGTLNVVPISLDAAEAKRGNVLERFYIPLNCELGSDFSRVVALTVERLKRSQWEEDSPYLIVNRASPSPFLPGLDRLSIIDASHWLAARRQTITLLKKPPLSADGRLLRSDGNYSLQIFRSLPTDVGVLMITDVYPRDCVYAPEPASKPWRTPEVVIKSPVVVQRSRSAVTGLLFRIDFGGWYPDSGLADVFAVVFMVDQHRSDLSKSLPSFSGALEIVPPLFVRPSRSNQGGSRWTLRSLCERYIPTRACTRLHADASVRDAEVRALLTGRAGAGQAMMTLILSVTRRQRPANDSADTADISA